MFHIHLLLVGENADSVALRRVGLGKIIWDTHVATSCPFGADPRPNMSFLQVHEAIREKPVLEKKERTVPAKKGTHWEGTPRKLTTLQRKEALKQRLAQLMEDA